MWRRWKRRMKSGRSVKTALPNTGAPHLIQCKTFSCEYRRLYSNDTLNSSLALSHTELGSVEYSLGFLINSTPSSMYIQYTIPTPYIRRPLPCWRNPLIRNHAIARDQEFSVLYHPNCSPGGSRLQHLHVTFHAFLHPFHRTGHDEKEETMQA